MSKIEDLIENLNGFGKYQKLRYFLICLSGLLPPIASYMHSFIASSPKYVCMNNSFLLNNNESFQYGLGYYYTEAYHHKCTESSLLVNINGTKKCTKWTFDKTYYQKTLTEEWNLVCDKAIWRSNMQALYFCGISIGSIILTKFSKKFGQKPVLIFSLLIILIGCVGLSFGPQKYFGITISYILLVAGRLLIAIGSHGVSINGYLLALETIGRSHKKKCALIFEFFFSFGQLVLVLAAYFLRDWRNLTFIILLPCLPFVLFICLANESISYLSSNKKYDKIQKVLEDIAKSNKTEFDQTIWKTFLVKENERTDKKVSITGSKPHLIIILILILNWIINNFVFHGLGLRSNDLGVNPYLTFALSAVVELVCSIFTFKLLQFSARRKPYFILMLISGICCTFVYFSKNILITVSSALTAKFSISASYAIIRFYSSELFPEALRTNYMANCSLMARVGSVIAPFIIGVGDYHFKQLPFLIFGIGCFVSAITSLGLPQIEREKLSPPVIDQSQQLLQNNWLDGQDCTNNIESIEDEEENNKQSLNQTAV